MGLAFTGTSAEAGATLLDWVTGLGGQPQPPRQPALEIEAVSETKPTGAHGVRDAVNELLFLLVRKDVLTESEASQLRDKIDD